MGCSNWQQQHKKSWQSTLPSAKIQNKIDAKEDVIMKQPIVNHQMPANNSMRNECIKIIPLIWFIRCWTKFSINTRQLDTFQSSVSTVIFLECCAKWSKFEVHTVKICSVFYCALHENRAESSWNMKIASPRKPFRRGRQPTFVCINCLLATLKKVFHSKIIFAKIITLHTR